MSESSDYTPAAYWQGHNFDVARKDIDRHYSRSYSAATSGGVSTADVVPDELRTDCEAPLVLVCDQTGSMGDWPKTVFAKGPYLEHEAKDYLGDGLEISFAAIGDAGHNESYPLQVRQFVPGEFWSRELKALIPEKKGGGNMVESYELAALYYARKVSMPRAIRKPIYIFIGDEGYYPSVDPHLATRYARMEIEPNLSTAQVFEELKQKFSVYLIKKPYGQTGGQGDEVLSLTDLKIYESWCKLLGADHICILPEAERVVDTIFGILARETNRVQDFRKEIEGRQRPDQVKTVYESLKTVHALAGVPRLLKGTVPGKSKTLGLDEGPRTKRLL